MVTEKAAIDKARLIATDNDCVWRDDDVHAELTAARAPSDNWLARKLLESARGLPQCWLVRMGVTPTTQDWYEDDVKAPRGEGYGYLIDADTGDFVGVDLGYKIILKQYTNLR